MITAEIMRRPKDAGLAKKAASKKRKATKRAGPVSDLDEFRSFTSPSGLQVLSSSKAECITPTYLWFKTQGLYPSMINSCPLIVYKCCKAECTRVWGAEGALF